MPVRHMVDWNRLKELREERGLSQPELGALVHRSKTTIWRIEQGKSLEMSTKLLQTFATALGVSPEELLAPTAFGQGARPATGVPLLPAAILTRTTREGISRMLAHWQGEEVVSDSRHAGCFAYRVEGDASDVEPGTVVIVDPKDVRLQEGALYLLTDGDAVVALRQRGGRPLRSGKLSVLGRVVFRGVDERTG